MANSRRDGSGCDRKLVGKWNELGYQGSSQFLISVFGVRMGLRMGVRTKPVGREGAGRERDGVAPTIVGAEVVARRETSQ